MKKNLLKVLVIIAALSSINCVSIFAENVTEVVLTEDVVDDDIIDDTIIDEIVIDETSNNKTKNDPEKKAYNEKAKVIKAEIKAINEEIKALKQSTKTIRTKYQEIVKKYNKEKVLSISEENFKKAKELKKTIPTSNKNKNEISLDSETSVQTYVKNKNYDAALNKLNANLAKKKESLAQAKEVNSIWKQIDALIS